MSKLTINFNNENKFTRDLEANCRALGYQELIDGRLNPETKQQFVERKLKEHFQENSKRQRFDEAFKNINIED